MKDDRWGLEPRWTVREEGAAELSKLAESTQTQAVQLPFFSRLRGHPHPSQVPPFFFKKIYLYSGKNATGIEHWTCTKNESSKDIVGHAWMAGNCSLIHSAFIYWEPTVSLTTWRWIRNGSWPQEFVVWCVWDKHVDNENTRRCVTSAARKPQRKHYESVQKRRRILEWSHIHSHSLWVAFDLASWCLSFSPPKIRDRAVISTKYHLRITVSFSALKC